MKSYRTNAHVFGLSPQETFDHADDEAMAPYVAAGWISELHPGTEAPAELEVEATEEPARKGRKGAQEPDKTEGDLSPTEDLNGPEIAAGELEGGDPDGSDGIPTD